MKSTSAGFLKWLGGILATIVTGVVVYWLTVGFEPANRPPPGHDDTRDRFRVVEVLLRADPFQYRGPCPVTVTFSGRISAAGGSGTVAYRFMRNDGASAPVQRVNFDGPGSRNVQTTWRIGGSTPAFRPYRGWQAIEILDPRSMKSGRAPFEIYCE